MNLERKQISAAIISILLLVFGVFWMLTWGEFCLGDQILEGFSLPAWSNGNTGTHYTLAYGLIFFLAALLLTHKHRKQPIIRKIWALTLVLCVFAIAITVMIFLF